MWWGGFVSPARFLASVLLPLAMPAAAWFASSGAGARLVGLGGLVLSVLLSAAIAGADRGALLFNTRDGFAKVLRWASPLVDLPAGLPSLFQTTPLAAVGRAGVWLIAILATAGVAWWLDRRRASRATAATAIGLTSALAGMAALSAVWMLNGAQPATPVRGAARLLRIIDADARQIGVRYEPLRRVRAAEVAPLLPVLAQRPPTYRPGDPLAVIADVAAGIYRIEAVVTGNAGTLTAGIDRQPAPLWSWDLSGVRGRWTQTLTVANDAHALRFDADGATSAALGDLTVRAERRFAGHERVSDRAAWRAARYGPATVFLLDGRAYVEPAGSWIAGGAWAEFAIVPDRGASVQLFVRNSGVANTVVLESARWRQRLTLEPREERTLDVPLDAGRPGVVLNVQSARGTRPSDLDEGNQDRRLLGCWIETR
jgi:hypothetical protein